MRETECKFSSTADNSCVSFEARQRERERGGTRADKGWGDSMSKMDSPTAKRESDGEARKQIVCEKNAPATLIKQFLHKSGVPTKSSH
jgi:hypothetical protein